MVYKYMRTNEQAKGREIEGEMNEQNTKKIYSNMKKNKTWKKLLKFKCDNVAIVAVIVVVVVFVVITIINHHHHHHRHHHHFRRLVQLSSNFSHHHHIPFHSIFCARLLIHSPFNFNINIYSARIINMHSVHSSVKKKKTTTTTTQPSSSSFSSTSPPPPPPPLLLPIYTSLYLIHTSFMYLHWLILSIFKFVQAFWNYFTKDTHTYR